MNGKFINTTMKTTIEHLAEGVKGRLDNPFYTFTDKAPTVVTFYNPNITASTLDEATKQIYESVGPQSGLRFNKIENVVLYGMEKIQLDIDIGEYGTEASPIEGEVNLLPDTFTPYPEAYFTINYIGKDYFFRVTKVNIDTLENGNNFYRLGYKLDNFDLDIESQVVNSYQMICGNIGSDFKSVIMTTEYDLISRIQDLTNTLKDYYNALFFKKRVQTFIFYYNDTCFYDPYVIEFLIRNDIMNAGTEKYTYITQQVYLPQTFCIDYDKSVFRKLEQKNKKIKIERAYGILIDDPQSLLTTRMEEYYRIDFSARLGLMAEPINVFDNDLIEVLTNGKIIEQGHPKEYYNIIGYYLDDKEITQNLIDSLDSIDYSADVELFYTIPMIIFILEKYAYNLLVTDKNGLA